MIAAIRKVLTSLFGSKTDEVYWKFRHLSGNWSKSYISKKSISHSHRDFLINKIPECNSILEIGCASGPNLYILSKKFPKSTILGIDISNSAIKEGNIFFKKNYIKNVFLREGKADDLRLFENKSIDIIFTDAVLIYLDFKKTAKSIKEMARVAKKEIILFEWHKQGDSIYSSHWVHDYKKILNDIGISNIEITKIPKGIWDEGWEKYGNIIKAKL